MILKVLSFSTIHSESMILLFRSAVFKYGYDVVVLFVLVYMIKNDNHLQ